MSKALDLKVLSLEQSSRAAHLGFIGLFLVQFGSLIHQGGGKIATEVWTLELVWEPVPWIDVRVNEPKLEDAIRVELRHHNYTVKSMRDLKQGVNYLVVLI